MVEVYSMLQAQRDAAHIAALEKQIADLTAVVKALACNRSHLDIHISALEIERAHDIHRLCREHAASAARQVALHILQELSDRGALYQKLAQYEQWFYAKSNLSTRMDALRSTMTTAK